MTITVRSPIFKCFIRIFGVKQKEMVFTIQGTDIEVLSMFEYKLLKKIYRFYRSKSDSRVMYLGIALTVYIILLIFG